MIRPPARDALIGAERHGLELLLDLARLPAVEDEAADVVRLDIVERDCGDPDLKACIAHGWHFEPADGVVRVPRGVLRLVTAVAGATAEQDSAARDRYGRVPATTNALVQAGLETEPVVSRAALRLRDAVLASAGRRQVSLVAPWPRGKRWAAVFTHDLDVVAYWPLFTLRRLAELARKAELTRCARTGLAALAAVGRDPVGQGVRGVLDTERAQAVISTWFVLCGTPTLATMRAGDLTYAPESRAATRIIQELVEHGCEIGLHGSFATSDRGELFGEQRMRLEGVTGRPVHGVRQHFLRTRPGVTEHAMRAAGFRYDATSGFADRNGFRLGVADVVPAWDAAAERSIGLDEVPLCWMDRALSKYRSIEDPTTWIAEGVALARACREVEGLWVGVWHPNLTPPLGFPGAPAAYRSLVDQLTAQDPFVAPLSDVVAWRVARRGIRIRRVGSDGRLEAHTTAPLPAPPVLEDPTGRM